MGWNVNIKKKRMGVSRKLKLVDELKFEFTFGKEEIVMLDELCQSKEGQIIFYMPGIRDKVIKILDVIGLKIHKDFKTVEDRGDCGIQLTKSGLDYITKIEESLAEDLLEHKDAILQEKKEISMEELWEEMAKRKIKFFNTLIKLQGNG